MFISSLIYLAGFIGTLLIVYSIYKKIDKKINYLSKKMSEFAKIYKVYPENKQIKYKYKDGK